MNNKNTEDIKSIQRYILAKGYVDLANLLNNSYSILDDSSGSFGSMANSIISTFEIHSTPEVIAKITDKDKAIIKEAVMSIYPHKDDSPEIRNIVYEIDPSIKNINNDNNVIVSQLEDIERIWSDNKNLKVFLSHKSEDRVEIGELKDKLAKFNVSCFVAHEDIEPTRVWQEEIENALFSMDICVAIMTEKFHNSNWTDQEIGIAYGRRVPIISVKLGTNPYGFIGKSQALSCSWSDLPIKLLEIFMQQTKMVDAYINLLGSVNSFGSDNSFGDANELSKLLPFIKALNTNQCDELAMIYNSNSELRKSYGFNSKEKDYWGNDLRKEYGKGLMYYLNKFSNNSYEEFKNKIINPKNIVETLFDGSNAKLKQLFDFLLTQRILDDDNIDLWPKLYKEGFSDVQHEVIYHLGFGGFVKVSKVKLDGEYVDNEEFELTDEGKKMYDSL